MSGLSFPAGFVWGAATAAHQVEGGNWNNDWWVWEHTPGSGCVEPSGDACDHFARYPEDIEILAGLGLGAYRFSLEWSRIEPEDGEFSGAALDHYRRMVTACRDNGVEPIVTFHHFTTPRWVAARGGWADPETAGRFARFAAKAAGHLGDLLGLVCTINEPDIVARNGYLTGEFTPGERDAVRRDLVSRVLAEAHAMARDEIRSACAARVGLTLAMADYQVVEPGGEAHLADVRDPKEDPFFAAAVGDDFFGVQTYTRVRLGAGGVLGPPAGAEVTQMGWEYWPAALGATVRRAWEKTGGTPILVTENGIATADDDRRIDFHRSALAALHAAMADGVAVEGYLAWSLLDNFEWARGYGPTFGLVAVDRATQRRVVKPSARWLGEVARTGKLVAP